MESLMIDPIQHSNRRALILGITGGFGGAVAAALAAHGWSIAALARNPETAKQRRFAFPIDWLRGDAMTGADTMRASVGATVIVKNN